MSPKITIVDYGVGNLHSLKKAFKFFNVEVEISEDPEKVLLSNAIILPGVGSYEAGIRGLKVRGLDKAVKKFCLSQKPVLGICLGAQLLLSEGSEFGKFKGLDVISGKVEKFSGLVHNEKIPQIGWNRVYAPNSVNWRGSIFEELPHDGFNAYFVHSYILVPESNENIFGLTSYDGKEFCSVVRKEKIFGCQFHPEKSGQLGLKIIKNFLDLI